MTNYYLCCGNKTGVARPDEWVGIDIEPPCDRMEDVRDILFLKDAEKVFATPPCDSFTDLPWRPATNKDTDVLQACLRLCMEAPEWLLECNRWAQKFIGPTTAHRSGHYFWGNHLLPEFKHVKMRTAGRQPLKRAALPVIWP